MNSKSQPQEQDFEFILHNGDFRQSRTQIYRHVRQNTKRRKRKLAAENLRPHRPLPVKLLQEGQGEIIESEAIKDSSITTPEQASVRADLGEKSRSFPPIEHSLDAVHFEDDSACHHSTTTDEYLGDLTSHHAGMGPPAKQYLNTFQVEQDRYQPDISSLPDRLEQANIEQPLPLHTIIQLRKPYSADFGSLSTLMPADNVMSGVNMGFFPNQSTDQQSFGIDFSFSELASNDEINLDHRSHESWDPFRQLDLCLWHV